MIFMLHKK